MKPACVLSWSKPATLAMPKSAILARPSQGRSTFDGFTSRWMTGEGSPVFGSVAECAAASASNTREQRNAVAAFGSARPFRRSARSLCSGIPSTYSSTMTSWSSSEKKS